MKNMKKFVSLGLVVTGNLMLAAAVAFLIVPNEILTGGVAGVWHCIPFCTFPPLP